MKARRIRKAQLEFLILQILSIEPLDLLTLGMKINQKGRRMEYKYVVEPMIQKGLIVPYFQFQEQ